MCRGEDVNKRIVNELYTKKKKKKISVMLLIKRLIGEREEGGRIDLYIIWNGVKFM